MDVVDSYGGGVNIDSANGGASAGTVTFTRVEISNNKAKQTGGGLNLFADNHEVVIDNSVIQNNTTTGATNRQWSGNVVLTEFAHAAFTHGTVSKPSYSWPGTGTLTKATS